MFSPTGEDGISDIFWVSAWKNGKPMAHKASGLRTGLQMFGSSCVHVQRLRMKYFPLPFYRDCMCLAHDRSCGYGQKPLPFGSRCIMG